MATCLERLFAKRRRVAALSGQETMVVREFETPKRKVRPSGCEF
ncbi:MAG: hypothetical protein ACI3Z6_00710 [Candidatus Onthomorpha sp.]|nr:hypothetical protein [Candidatus Onthomorpha sp.]MDY5920887.1 hypothetical protein [Candidatus Onthomorpha sp.]